MLDLIRRKTKSPYIQGTILIIILVFVFWLPRAGRNGSQNSVATIDDDAISYKEFQQTYDRIISQYRDQFGGSLPKGLIKTLKIKEQVVNQLIGQHLVRRAALESGLDVSKDEIRNTIQKMEAFRTNGSFDIKRYKQILSASRMSVSDFESSIRSDILNRKITDHLSRFAKISEAEISDMFNYEYGEVKLEYAVFDAAKYDKAVTVTDKSLTAFFNEKKDNYKTPPQVRLKYLIFPFDQSAVNISDKAVEEYYQSHRDKYEQPEQRRARHILIRSSETDCKDTIDKKHRQIEDILKKVRAGEDFAKLAKKYSEDGTASRGGDLGYFARGQMIKPFENAVFTLKKGEISDVIKTRFGFHIIKLESIQPARTVPLTEARAGILAALRSEEAKNNAFNLANKAYEGIILAGNMDKYAKANKVTVQETDFFSRQHPPEQLAAYNTFLNTAFSLKNGELSSLIESDKGYGIIYVENMKNPKIPPLNDVKERVEKDFIADQAKKMTHAAAEKMLTGLKGGSSFDDAAGKARVAVKETGFFSRTTRSQAGLPSAVIEEGLQLSAKKPYPKEITADGSRFYVYRFKEKRMPAKELFAEKTDGLKKQILQNRQKQLFADWIAFLRQNAEITINQQFLQ